MITKLNTDAIQDSSITYSKLSDEVRNLFGGSSSSNVKYFTTEVEYNTAYDNGELEFPCVVYIEQTDKTLFLTGGGSYNAIIEYNEAMEQILGEYITNLGCLPISLNPQYYEYFMLDGVDILSTNTTTISEQSALALYDINVGDSFEVEFKFKDVLELTYDDETVMQALYMCCSYLEVDESFYNKIIMEDQSVPVGLYMPTLGPNFTCKFIGDFNVDPLLTSSVIMFLLYGPLAYSSYMPETQFNIVLQIPEGNTSYGNPSDKQSQEDEATTFYGICNAIIEMYGNPENISLTVETY